MTKCNSCNYQNSNIANFCENCGAKITEYNTKKIEKKNKDTDRKNKAKPQFRYKLFKMSIALIVVISVFGLIFQNPSNTSKKEESTPISPSLNSEQTGETLVQEAKKEVRIFDCKKNSNWDIQCLKTSFKSNSFISFNSQLTGFNINTCEGNIKNINFMDFGYLTKYCKSVLFATILENENFDFEKNKKLFCNVIDNNTLNCNNIIAITKNKPEKCNFSDNDDTCINSLAYMNKDFNLFKCSELALDPDICYFVVGLRIRSPEYCDSLSNYKLKCFENLYGKYNYLYCVNQEHFQKRYDCTEDAYNRSPPISIESCNAVHAIYKNSSSGNAIVNDCYQRLMKKIEFNEKNCSLLQEKQYKEKCYFEAAKQDGNRDLCNKSGNYEEDCLIYVQRLENRQATK